MGTFALFFAVSAAALGCPFCTALEPTLSSRRDAAAVVALGEVQSGGLKPADAKSDEAKLAEAKPAEQRSLTIRLHRTLKGDNLLVGQESIVATAGGPLKSGALVLVFGEKTEGEQIGEGKSGLLSFTAIPVTETSYAYFAQAPDLRKPAPQRLQYFARFLEHADPSIASDAYQEFAHASFADVEKAASSLPFDKMRGWLLSERVPPARKGFYGLALALVENEHLRKLHADRLFHMILSPADDFRAGFDGIIGGYLLVRGASGLDQIDELYLSNPKAADGDVRHALAALRFYREFGQDIPRARLAQSLRLVLARPEFAEAVVTDLARWQDWSAVDKIAGLYTQDAYAQPAVRRAIVGYLLTCPETAATRQLQRLRGIDPPGVAAAEQVLSSLGGSRQ